MKNEYEITTLEALRRIVVCNEKQSKALEDRLYNYLDEFAQRFIRQSPTVFFATADASGHVDVSPKGDAPGFVEIKNEHTLLFPERQGNTDARNLRNILQNNQVSLLFVIPRHEEVLRVTGTATILVDPELLARMTSCNRPAQLCVNIRVKECFFHCARAFKRSHLWRPEKWPTDTVRYNNAQIASRKKMRLDEVTALSEKIISDLGEKDGAF